MRDPNPHLDPNEAPDVELPTDSQPDVEDIDEEPELHSPDEEQPEVGDADVDFPNA
jgi:hypothetical protein